MFAYGYTVDDAVVFWTVAVVVAVLSMVGSFVRMRWRERRRRRTDRDS